MLINKQNFEKEYEIINCNFKVKFEQLKEEEKGYLYYLSKGIWDIQLISLDYKSYESSGLFIIFQTFFNSFDNNVDKVKEKINEVISKNDPQVNNLINNNSYLKFLKYAAEFYSNFGNYSSFDRKKIIPELDNKSFKAILELSNKKDEMTFIWQIIEPIIYDKDSNYIQLEEKNGKNRFYLGNIKYEEIQKVDAVLKTKNINIINTRLIKINQDKIIVLISCTEEKQENIDSSNIILLYGEFSNILKKVVQYLKEAQNHITNEQIKENLSQQILQLQTGKITVNNEGNEKSKQSNSSRSCYDIQWSYSKFDPLGIRGILNGWIILFDEEMLKKYSQIVQKEFFTELLSEFPWGEEFDSPVENLINNIQKYNPNYIGPLNDYKNKIITFLNNSKSNFQHNQFEFNDKKLEKIITNFRIIVLDIFLTCRTIFRCYHGKFFRLFINEKKTEEPVKKDEIPEKVEKEQKTVVEGEVKDENNEKKLKKIKSMKKIMK